MEYYVFSTEQDAQDCINYINSTPWFPIVGCVNGIPVPDSQQTTSWCDVPVEMLSGDWAVPRIPESRLDSIGVPQVDRDSFLAVYGQDIRDLCSSDFPVEEEL